MITAIANLEPLARDIMCQEWRRLYAKAGRRFADAAMIEAPLHLLPDLLRMMDDHHGTPVRDLTPTVRLLLSDLHFIDQNGDRALVDNLAAELDRQAEAVICVLERVREQAMSQGQWSDAPVTAMWFG